MPKHYQKLIDLFPFSDYRIIAVIGGGGKTSLLFALGEELSAKSPVILSTTTHMHYPSHLDIKQIVLEDDPDQVRLVLSSYPLCYVAAPYQHNKLQRPSDQMLQIVEEMGIPVLYEADGSRSLPIKCMGEQEPAVPSSCSLVIQMIGASCLHQTISKVVHRYELACERWHWESGELVTIQHLITLASYNFSKTAAPHKLLIINQCDTGITNTECQEIRSAFPNIPVLFVSLKNKQVY